MSAQEHAPPLYVVGIGASAGGLDPIEKFFDNLPRDTGMAFVVVQHLSPDFKSLMDELLARHTDMPIHLVEDGMVVEANHVYLIPSKKEMIISDGRLLLSDRRGQRELTLPIDVFFRSLAQDCGARAIAIVLSGGGSDGSRGIRDIREAGGLIIVQDTESAQFDGMPKTAREAGVAHWVLAPQEMPGVLMQHLQNPAAETLHAAEPPGLAAVYRMLQLEYGLDFTHYKPTTVTRRIERRLALASTPDIEEYVERLRRDHAELDLLYRDLLIGVTHFFRDPQAFDVLEQSVLPDLLERASADKPLRIWVAGCATGEEAYSFAIALSELMRKTGERPVKIFATDVHRGSLERAARGIYPAEALGKVSMERLDRYFVRVGDDYQIVPDLRQMVVFAAQDVIKDAPFTRVDLVSCRNMLIYLQPAAQRKVLSLFVFALNRGGVLMLGPSESPGALGGDFESIDARWKIYRKHTDARLRIDVPSKVPLHHEARIGLPSVVSSSRHTLTELLGTYDALLDEIMPASLLTNEQGELVHAFGGASRFLKARDGRQGLLLLDAVDGELRMVLTGGLKRSLVEPSKIIFKGVRVESNGKSGAYNVTVRRIPARNQAGAHVLVTLEPVAADAVLPVRDKEIDLDEVSRAQLATLESELSHTKESLQAAIEELQSTNEELQASNEELQASNEELQSTNEELQSVNEELYTVNAEYQRKIAELTELTNDMDNLLSSTAVGTIFLDKELTIRKFTPQIAETFSLMPHDVGRSIETFAHRLEHPELVDDMRRVVATSTVIERELRDVNGKSLFMRVLPYRARGRSDGVVLTVIDVSGLKAAEDALFHERYLLNSLLHGVPDAIYFKDSTGKFIRTNGAMASRFGLDDPKVAVGKTPFEMPNRESASLLHQEDLAVLRTGEPQLYQLQTRMHDGRAESWDLITRLPLRDGQDKVVGIIVISRDVTEQKRAEEKAEEAVRRRDQFLAMLSHELRNPLGAIVSASTLMARSDDDAPAHVTHALEVIGRQSQQMARLLDDLLEVSRVTQNKIELRKQPLDLAATARDTAEASREHFARAGLTLDVSCDVQGAVVHADPARVQQILANLLGNAAKYTPRGGKVTLSVCRQENECVLSVRDTGAGIPSSMLDSVFDLFVQASRTLDRSAGGIGVGLTLVRSLVAMHDGSVTAESDGEGTGSEFIIRLPITAANVDAAVVAPSSVPSLHARDLTSGRIVVVEDNTDSREMLCEILAMSGYECHAAANGVAALALIAEVNPDVAIVDIGLPEMDGYAVARSLRAANHSNLWLIALTGYGQSIDRAASREAGFDEHLVKPVQTHEILHRLAAMKVPRSVARTLEA
jgi:two-component system, chemotaxis family, CheB/CheR fusion protein